MNDLGMEPPSALGAVGRSEPADAISDAPDGQTPSET